MANQAPPWLDGVSAVGRTRCASERQTLPLANSWASRRVLSDVAPNDDDVDVAEAARDDHGRVAAELVGFLGSVHINDPQTFGATDPDCSGVVLPWVANHLELGEGRPVGESGGEQVRPETDDNEDVDVVVLAVLVLDLSCCELSVRGQQDRQNNRGEVKNAHNAARTIPLDEATVNRLKG